MEMQPPMAQGRSTKTISMIQWIRTSSLSIKNSLSGREDGTARDDDRPGSLTPSHPLTPHISALAPRASGTWSLAPSARWVGPRSGWRCSHSSPRPRSRRRDTCLLLVHTTFFLCTLDRFLCTLHPSCAHLTDSCIRWRRRSRPRTTSSPNR